MCRCPIENKRVEVENSVEARFEVKKRIRSFSRRSRTLSGLLFITFYLFRRLKCNLRPFDMIISIAGIITCLNVVKKIKE